MPFSLNIKRVVNIVVALIVVGVFLWLVNTYIPMAGAIKGLLNIVVVVACCVLVLQAVGLWTPVILALNRMRLHASARETEPKPATPKADSAARNPEKQAVRQ
jgi:membrane-bound ClpP family serine protease